MKVLLIIGGQSTENKVSRMSATNIYNSINKNHEVSILGITEDGIWYELNSTDFINDFLKDATKVIDILGYLKKFDVVFPVLHGLYGEDGTIQGLLELSKVPYVGMKVLGSSISLDKVYTKILLNGFNIKQVPYLYIKKKHNKELVLINENMEEKTNILETVKEKLGYPVFVKAANQGSSVGCYKVNSADKLMENLNLAASYDCKILIEKAINARELECAVLGNDDIIVSDVGEILPHGEFYSYESKYLDSLSQTKIPADINEEIREYIKTMSIKIFKILDGHGLSRCDFFLDKDTNEVYFNEINTMPGFTDISMYPLLMNNINIDMEKLIDILLNLAIEG